MRARLALVGAVLLTAAGLGTVAQAQGQLFVSNWYDATVTAYPRTADGDVSPSFVIPPVLNGPHQLAFNPLGNELVVAYYLRSAVVIYDAPTGAVKRTIAGGATQLSAPIGVAVDEQRGELVVTNFNGRSITVFDLNASGDVAPLRTIAGPSTGLNPVGVGVDPVRDQYVVANNDNGNPRNSPLSFYPRTATGDVAPVRVIQGPATGLYLPQGVAVDLVNDEVIVANSYYTLPNLGAILTFDLAVDGNVAPVRTLAGVNTKLCTPIGLTLDRVHNELFVANSNYGGGTCQASVAVYAWPTLLAPGTFDVAPIRVLTGNQTQVNYPFSVAVAPGALPAAPTVLGSNVAAEATVPGGAMVTFLATAQDANGNPLAVNCGSIPVGSPALFPLGVTTFICTSVPDAFGQVGTRQFTVTVVDTTAPTFFGIRNITVEASGPQDVSWDDVRAEDLGELVPVDCNPSSGSIFNVGETRTVTCTATDASGNTATAQFTVTVLRIGGELPGGACFVVDFREITYFQNSSVIASSDQGIRTRNGLGSTFNASAWPYPSRTKSRGTLFRIYGFKPSELGELVPNEDQPSVTYPVLWDAAVNGYYIDLGGPARVRICPDQLHDYVLAGNKWNGHYHSSALLPSSQRNVPGLMLTHNQQIVKLPRRVRSEMSQLGLANDERGMINYIGVQLQGSGSASYREFVDVRVEFPGDSQTDRVQHYTYGLHTALNTNFESFAGCNYVDYAPGNDSVRLRDVWGANKSSKQGYRIWEACGSREPGVNQKQRENFELPYNAVQVLPTVNTGTDTLRIFYGKISRLSDTEKKRKDHKLDWSDWDVTDLVEFLKSYFHF